MPRILVVDADEGRNHRLLASLNDDVFDVEVATSGAEARQLIEFNRPDVILVDPATDEVDGVELCRRLHIWPGSPIIAMSADSREQAQLALFDAGVDDVVVKPISDRLLLARIRVQLRHAASVDQAVGEVIEVGDLRIDTAALEAEVAGVAVALSRQQFTILRVLMHNVGAVVTPEVISRALGRSGGGKDVHAVRIAMSRLRATLGAGRRTPQIVTERASGYRLVPPPSA